MPSTEFEDVRSFHKKFGHPLADMKTPGLLTKRKLRERVEHLLEEIEELVKAGGLELSSPIRVREKEGVPQDLCGQADALVDLVYVALGTAVMEGLPWGELWEDVHRANMEKVPGQTKRGHSFDVAKPSGWVGPLTDTVLSLSGYKPSVEPERDDVLFYKEVRNGN